MKLSNNNFPVFKVDYIVLWLYCLKITNNSIPFKRNPNNLCAGISKKRRALFSAFWHHSFVLFSLF